MWKYLKIEMTQVRESSIWGHPRDHIPSGETSGSISLDWLNHFPVQGWNNGVKKGIWIQQLLSKVISYSTIYTKRLPHLSNVGQLIASKTQQGIFPLLGNIYKEISWGQKYRYINNV